MWGRSRIRRRERLLRRSLPRPPTCRKRSASTRDMSTRGSRTPRAIVWNRTWLRWKGARLPRSFPAGWRRSMPSRACSSRATMFCAGTISMGEPCGCSTRSGQSSGCSSVTWILPIPNVERGLNKNTRLVFIETPTNPLMALTDIRAVSEVCRKKKVDLVVDNTFMSPYFQQPLALGADLVVHSTTKFLNGHSDGLGGVVVCKRAEQAERLAFLQKAAGAILSPFECWLILRGVKTLAVRMQKHDESGR